MSRNFAVLGKSTPASTTDSPAVQPAGHSGEYTELIQRLFPGPSVVAIIGAGSADSGTAVCEGIASELSRLGRRVVLVSVQRLLPMDPITLPDETAFMPGPARNVWIWPSPMGQQIEFFKPRLPVGAENWLDALRRNFDSVLLDCPAVESAPLSVAIAARADAAVLAVEAARTPKSQILRDQRSLELSGVKLAGCILIK
jgi:Mrp family chromosome partitioning ATPase